MKKLPQLALPFLQRKKPGEDGCAAMLEILPQPALLLQRVSGAILFANQPALTASGYDAAEITGLKLSDLFSIPDPMAGIALDAAEEAPLIPESLETSLEQQAHIHPKQAAAEPGYLTLQTAPTRSELILATWEPQASPHQKNSAHDVNLWPTLLTLATLAQAGDFGEALETALGEVHKLLQADLAALYLANENQPSLRRLRVVGEASLLPEQLPVEELHQHRTPAIWTPRKRSSGSLHHMAARARFAHLASAPLGQNRATIGLVVIAGHKPPLDKELTLVMTRMLAASLTNLVQIFSLSSDHQDVLLAHERTRSSLKILEDSIAEGVIFLNQQLRIQRMNPAAELMLGYTTREVKNQPVDRILIGSQSLVPALEAAQQGSPSFNLGAIQLYRRNGEQFLCQARTQPVLEDKTRLREKTLQGIIILLQDLNEQERIRLQSQQMEQQALLGEVMAIFAHEVRNPINNLSTGLQVLAMKLPSDNPTQAAIARMEEDLERLDGLMSNVLNYARATEFEMGSIEIGPFLQRLLDRVHPRLNHLNITCDLQIDPNCHAVTGNARALDQVFSNLITNALQAMEGAGGRLLLKVRRLAAVERIGPRGRDYLEISIADTGPGISPDALGKIFQPFFTTKPNGTGLGLPICKRIITAHQGTLQAESFPGATIFHVQLPAADPPSLAR